MNEEMRIIELSVRGIRKLEAVDIQFTDGVNVLMGKTRQGKTSVLETLALSLKGFKGGTRDLILHGKKDGSIVSTFEIGSKTYKVERKLEHGKPPQLKLWLMEGDKPKTMASPQKFLEDLIPAIGETPGSFLKKSALEKLKFVLSHHDVDMSEFEKKIAEHTAKRQELTAQQKLYAYAEKTPVTVPNARKAEIEKELADIEVKNAAIEKKFTDKAATYKKKFHEEEAAYKDYKTVMDGLAPAETELTTRRLNLDFEQKEILRLEEELAERKKKFTEEQKSFLKAEANLLETKKKVEKVEEPNRDAATLALEKMRTDKNSELISTEVLTKELKEIEEADGDVDTYLKDHEAFKTKTEEIRKANSKIKEVKDLLIKTLAEIPAKLEGLKIEHGEEGDRPKGLYVDGIFSEEWSGAEGFAIAAKLLRRYSGQSVLIIDQGESIYYDTVAFKEFCDWARKDGVQVIISVVGEQEPGSDADKGFIIEDGGCREISVKQEDLL